MNTAAPYINTDKNVLYISSAHLVSLVPVMAAAVVYYGIRAAVLIAFCALVFALSDELCSKISGKVYARDLSSLFYGAAYALLLPPDTPLYIALTGVLFGSIAVRQLSGGRGSALFNPAAAGRFFIRLVFPGNETAFAAPGADRLAVRSLLYGPEGTVSFDLSDYSTSEILAGRFPSFIGTACVFMILAGMIYLIIKGVLKAYIPVSYVAMLSILLFVCDVYLARVKVGLSIHIWLKKVIVPVCIVVIVVVIAGLPSVLLLDRSFFRVLITSACCLVACFPREMCQ